MMMTEYNDGLLTEIRVVQLPHLAGQNPTID